jgi:hypothetical protein
VKTTCFGDPVTSGTTSETEGHPATRGVVVDDDTIILKGDNGGRSIVAVYRIIGASKLKLLAW